MKKILIVEDDKKIAQLEQAYLEMGGYETFCVYDGADVEAEAEKNQYDLILLDLMLPNCSGHTICENLRKKTDIPILMVTALGDLDWALMIISQSRLIRRSWLPG